MFGSTCPPLRVADEQALWAREEPGKGQALNVHSSLLVHFDDEYVGSVHPAVYVTTGDPSSIYVRCRAMPSYPLTTALTLATPIRRNSLSFKYQLAFAALFRSSLILQ